jgi:hypothetical protein
MTRFNLMQRSLDFVTQLILSGVGVAVFTLLLSVGICAAYRRSTSDLAL